MVVEKLRQSKVSSLSKAAEMIKAHEADLPQFLSTDEKGRQLPAYLVKVSQFLADEQDLMLNELRSMTKGLEHIREVVRMQQSFAKTTSALQSLSPAEIFEEAAKVNLISMDNHSIELVRDYQDCPPILIDKHQTLQILINLISNAKNAVKENADSSRTITLRLRRQMQEGEAQVVFEVQDTGVGIDPGLFTRIFSHGFTTRREGHGFGLHSAANSARAMGGRLDCHSDGPGTGATFTLVLPAKTQLAEAA
jgi:signal transduction histidine kinase